jgi:hypothetical protein
VFLLISAKVALGESRRELETNSAFRCEVSECELSCHAVHKTAAAASFTKSFTDDVARFVGNDRDCGRSCAVFERNVDNGTSAACSAREQQKNEQGARDGSPKKKKSTARKTHALPPSRAHEQVKNEQRTTIAARDATHPKSPLAKPP